MEKLLINTGPSPRGWHRLELASRCLRLYAYRYRLGIDLWGAKTALVRGSLVHIGLAHVYAQMRAAATGGDPGRYHDPLDAVAEAVKLPEFRQEGPGLVEGCQGLVRAYLAKHASERMDVQGVEEVVEAKLGGRYLLTQRWDLRYRDASGLHWVVDHKCLPGTTLVETERGSMRADALAAQTRDNKILAWTGALFAPCRYSARPAGVQDVYRVKLANGLVGSYGYRHPILTRRGWVEARDVRVGDVVAVAIGLGRADSDVPTELFPLAAMLLSDGTLKRASPTYHKCDPAKRAYFTGLLDRMKSPWRERTDPTGRRVPYIQLPFDSAAVLALRTYGLPSVGSAEKYIPASFLWGGAAQAGLMLGGFWMGDGAMYEVRRSTADARTSVRIVYGSRSEQLCHDIARLLTMQLGIPTTVTSSSVLYKGTRRGYHFATVVGREGKLAFLRKVVEGVIAAPTEVEKAKHLIEVLANPDRRAESAHRKQSIDGMIQRLEVVSNLYIGQQLCWDIEVDEHHTLVADGMVTHNTTSSPSVQTVLRYSLSGQFLAAQLIGQAKFGPAFGGVVLNLIGTRPGTYTFLRERVKPVPAALGRFSADMVELEDRLATLEGRDPWDYPGAWHEHACMTAYGACPGYALCQWGPSMVGRVA